MRPSPGFHLLLTRPSAIRICVLPALGLSSILIVGPNSTTDWAFCRDWLRCISWARYSKLCTVGSRVIQSTGMWLCDGIWRSGCKLHSSPGPRRLFCGLSSSFSEPMHPTKIPKHNLLLWYSPHARRSFLSIPLCVSRDSISRAIPSTVPQTLVIVEWGHDSARTYSKSSTRTR